MATHARSYGDSRICILNQSLNPLPSGRALTGFLGSFYAGPPRWSRDRLSPGPPRWSRNRLSPVVSVAFSLQHLASGMEGSLPMQYLPLIARFCGSVTQPRGGGYGQIYDNIGEIQGSPTGFWVTPNW